MTQKDFTTTIVVDQTPDEVFNAINNVRGWWSQQVDGSTDTANSVFTYQYQDVHICRIEITELVPAKKVEWLVLNNHFSFTKDKKEWTGTKIRFEIDRKNDKTLLRFTHVGLVPDYECFEICQEGWTNYIETSLHDLITTGQGSPNPREGKGFNASIVEKWQLDRAH
ncbi:MAG: SRPBCC domain-containing protein [Bacteroidia bacterium]|nr:SRPBCC domain-containing protein [Bacteroidia bacterium]